MNGRCPIYGEKVGDFFEDFWDFYRRCLMKFVGLLRFCPEVVDMAEVFSS